jgi:Tfp pilus assembly protein PilO
MPVTNRPWDVAVKVFMPIVGILLVAVIGWLRDISSDVNTAKQELAATKMWREANERYFREIDQLREATSGLKASMGVFAQKLERNEERVAEVIGSINLTGSSIASFKGETISGFAKLTEKLIYIQNVLDAQKDAK